MYTGGTTLLTEAYEPAEKARVQGVNDLILFVTMTVSSLTSGALVTSAGWETANWAAVPALLLVAVAVAALGWQRRAMRTAAAA
jgi:MFS family permease